MRKFLLILVIILPIMVMGQSKEADEYYYKGVNYYKWGLYEKAISYFENSYSVSKKQHEDTLIPLKAIATCYNTIASNNSDCGNYYEAIKFQLRAHDLFKNISGESDTIYAKSLYKLAGYYNKIGNYTEAIKLCSQASEIFKQNYGEEHPHFATSLNTLALYNALIGNYIEAIRLGTQALRIRSKVFGENHPSYATSLNNLAGYYEKIGYYTEAIKLGTLALEIRRKALGDNHPDFANSLNNLAGYYDKIGNYYEAIKLGTMALKIRKKSLILSENHFDYTTQNIDDFVSYKMFHGGNHLDYATTLNNLSTYYYHIGNTPEAISLITLAMFYFEVISEEHLHPFHATLFSNLAIYDDEIGNYSEAIKFDSLALIIQKKILGENHPDYATTLNNLATCYCHIGNSPEAIRLSTRALGIIREVFGEEHPLYATSLSNVASNYSLIGNYTDAIKLGTLALEIRRKALGENHPDYANSLNNLAGYYYANSDYNKGSELLNQYYNTVQSNLLHYFTSMTAIERNNYWTQREYGIFKQIPLLSTIKKNAETASLAYNYLLFSKGLLLNAEIEIQNLITNRGNNNLKDRFVTLRSNQAMLDKFYQLPLNQRTINTDSLKTLIERDEKYLMENIKELGDYTRNLSIEWQDVQNKLSDKDIAIEFADFEEDGKQYYIALILKKGMSAPEVEKISFSEKDLANCYQSPSLYNAIWQPLKKYLKGVKNVYFAPSGKFYTCAIEYLPDENGKIFAQKYNAYRLSSTRELAMEHKTNPNKKAATYGGISYNFDSSDWDKELEKVKNDEDVFRDIPMINDVPEPFGDEIKGATLAESDSVKRILTSARYTVIAKSLKDATEGSFKALSGKGLKILHIATHGFYSPEKDSEKSSLTFFAHENNNKEDRSLSRSGLYMAGANYVLDSISRKYIPDGVDDGILTALEISRLDFKGLDLVVLSACHTGLGEVTGEGVFGLQRGFKKSGAQTIIMSLWKANNLASQLLMTEFFRNLAAGKSKREAFLAAQSSVKQKYHDPIYWAAFVMVDGEE